jgi:hypothetical protein
VDLQAQPAHNRPGHPRPVNVINVHTYSNTSSEIGVGVVIRRGEWNACGLIPRWKDAKPYSQDIQWAKAIGFKFACCYVFDILRLGTHIRFWCDNQSVTKGWWKWRSGNKAANNVFKHLGNYLESVGGHTYTLYVESAHNPANAPSCFKFSGLQPDQNLPTLNIPANLHAFVVDHCDKLSHTKSNTKQAPAKHNRVLDSECVCQCDTTHTLSLFHTDLAGNPSLWWEDRPKC